MLGAETAFAKGAVGATSAATACYTIKYRLGFRWPVPVVGMDVALQLLASMLLYIVTNFGADTEYALGQDIRFFPLLALAPLTGKMI